MRSPLVFETNFPRMDCVAHVFTKKRNIPFRYIKRNGNVIMVRFRRNHTLRGLRVEKKPPM